MEDNKNNEQQTQQSSGQNPTLGSPGSQVADYGSPTGGSGDGPQQQQGNKQQEGDANKLRGNNETVGNP